MRHSHINVPYSPANASGDAVAPETHSTVAERAQKEELHLRELKFSEQADLIRWHSEHSADVERDEHIRLTRSRSPRKTLRVSI